MNTRLLLIVLSLSFSGCSLIYSYSDNLPHRINQWIAEKKYNVALNTINHIKPTHKDYPIIQRKKTVILKQMVDYENMAIEKSSQLVRQGNWLLALDLLDEVAGNIIDTHKIDNHRDKILQKRGEIITNYENDILNNQAINLISKIELYEKIKKTVTKNENNELEISKFDNLRRETSLSLAKRCELQFEKGQYSNALTTIDLALKLNPDEDIVSRLEETRKSIQEENKLNKSSYIKDSEALLTKLSQGYSHAILKETKEKITWLNKIKEEDPIYINLITRLQKHLKTGIKMHFDAARKLYSNGKTQEALSIWVDIKELEPEYPKLQSHINRAEKILIKLEELSNKPINKNIP